MFSFASPSSTYTQVLFTTARDRRETAAHRRPRKLRTRARTLLRAHHSGWIQLRRLACKLASCNTSLQVRAAAPCGLPAGVNGHHEPRKTIVAVQILPAVCQGNSLDASSGHVPRDPGLRVHLGRLASATISAQQTSAPAEDANGNRPANCHGPHRHKGARARRKARQNPRGSPGASSCPCLVNIFRGTWQCGAARLQALQRCCTPCFLPESVQQLLSQQMDADMAAKGRALQKHVKSQTSKAKQLATLRGQRAAYVQEWDRYVNSLNETVKKQMAEREATLGEFAKTEAELQGSLQEARVAVIQLAGGDTVTVEEEPEPMATDPWMPTETAPSNQPQQLLIDTLAAAQAASQEAVQQHQREGSRTPRRAAKVEPVSSEEELRADKPERKYTGPKPFGGAKPTGADAKTAQDNQDL